MDGNTWIKMMTMAVLMLSGTGMDTNPVHQKVHNCLKNNDNSIGIVDGEFNGTGWIIFNWTRQPDRVPTNCTFAFGSTPNTIKYRRHKFTYGALQFWLKRQQGGKEWHLDLKGEEFHRKFKIYICDEGNCIIHDLNTTKKKDLCDSAVYVTCEGRHDEAFGYRIYMNKEGITSCDKCGEAVAQAPPFELPSNLLSDVELGFSVGTANNDSNETMVEKVEPSAAAKIMQKLSAVSELMGNRSLASISVGPIKGVMVKPEDEEDLKKLSFVSSDSDLNLIEDEDELKKFPLSVSVSEEAYKKAFYQDKNKTFVGVFRFPNMTGENDTALSGQVYAIDMGTNISNLSEPIQISYNTHPPEGFSLSCQSWDGEGDQPNWTDAGCITNISDHDVTCECSHLTFFAVLMTPLEKNETISASDLESLTYISYIGCGVSLFFLGIALFMFCCIRRASASNAIHILIHLLLALFLLNTSFLTNEWIANLNNVVACKVIAGFMHYSMLCSFTWFAVEAFHLCLQLTSYATVSIPNYKLKLCCVGWIPGALVVLIMFSIGKYGELNIYATNGTETKMCWILDNRLQYGINIGYYAIVFAFTFTIFVVMLRWLCYLRRSKVKEGSEKPGSTRSQDVVTIMGLCCMLGITWSFAFFSHGPLRLPSFYIFTILNSLQGFFLFLYYYNTSRVIGDGDTNSSSSSSSSTKTIISKDDSDNPYK